MGAARIIQISLLLLVPLVAAAGGQSDASPPRNPSAEVTPQAQEERATAPASAKSSAHKQAGPAPARAAQKSPPAKRLPPRRRSVQQSIGSVVQPTPTQSYGPVLAAPAYTYPAQTNPALPPVAGTPPLTPPPPSQLNSCSGSFCTDAAGATYNNGVGGAAVNSQGRLCNKVGNTMQCF